MSAQRAKIFSQLIIDAAKLRLVQRQREIIQNQFEDGSNHLVLYAVDTDVVKLFSDPVDVGVKSGYAQIFSSDPTQHAVAFAKLLGDHIFYHLGKIPVFQLSPHEQETAKFYDRVAKKAYKKVEYNEDLISDYHKVTVENLANQMYQTYKSDISNIRNPMLMEENSVDAKEENINSSLDQIIQLSIGKLNTLGIKQQFDHEREFSRFLQIHSDNRLLTVEKLIELSAPLPSGNLFATALKPSEDWRDWIRDSERKEFWKSALSRENPKRGKVSLEADADALTSLERINRNLNSIGAKVILISGDDALHRAVEKGANKHASAFNALVVHPKAFLVDAIARTTSNFTSNDGKPAKRFQKWLDGLLTNYTGDKQRYWEDINALASANTKFVDDLLANLENLYKSLSKGNDPHTDAIEEWEALKMQIISLDMGYSDDKDDFFQKLIGKAQTSKTKVEIKKVIVSLRKHALSNMDRLWDNLLIAFTSAGVDLLYAFRGGSGQRQRMRNPPIIRFDSFSTATELVHALLQKHKLEEIVNPTIEERLDSLTTETLSNELGNTDLGYLSCLVYATICAAEGKWYVARGLAERAVRIAEGKVKTKSGSTISGREAYYLLSCATRMTISVSMNRKKCVRMNLRKLRSI